MGEGNVFSLFTSGRGGQSSQPGGGVSPASRGGGSVQPGGGSVQLAGGVSPAGGGGSVQPAGGGSAKIGLTTRRAVCLLRSRRRTFLLSLVVNCESGADKVTDGSTT